MSGALLSENSKCSILHRKSWGVAKHSGHVLQWRDSPGSERNYRAEDVGIWGVTLDSSCEVEENVCPVSAVLCDILPVASIS